MTYLLDTHALIWATTAPAKLSRKVAALINDESNLILVSAASAWEVATKFRLGRLPEAILLESAFLQIVAAAGYELRDITAVDGLRAGRLSDNHGDPFDRMIAAQALAEDIPVLSNDTKLDGFGVRRIW